MWLGGNRNAPNYTETYLTFDLTVRASHLWVAPYNDYQQYLYETIMEFREKGWTFKQIAKWFRDNGYETVTGKRFYATHVFSILKKKRLRDERLSSIPKDRFEIGPLRIEYVERKLINSI